MAKPALSSPIRMAVEIAIYLSLTFLIVYWCLQIVSPFISILLWGTVIAVAVYGSFKKLRDKLGGNNKLAVMAFVVIGLGIIILPTWMFAGSVIESVQGLSTSLEAGQFSIPPANESVKEWPLIGEKLFTNWSAAAANFQGWMQAHNDQITPLLQGALNSVNGVIIAILLFILSTLIAAAMLANDESMTAGIRRLCARLLGDRADEVLTLATATIRSVAVGVLGIAVIQAVAGGAGMMLMGVPGAGLWALFILILAIAQLPPLLVLIPVIIYVFSTGDNMTANLIFTVWSIIVAFSDTFLKPLLLGRGVEAPMLVILLGAIGGLVHSGFIGLFLGAVILALGYQLFTAWMEQGEEDEAGVAGEAEET